jgi:hypothetical protein
VSLLVGLVAAASFAQLPENSSLLPAKQVRLLVANYGDCIVKREPRLAAEAILRGDEDRDLISQYPRLVQETCVPMQGADRVQVSFSGNQYRYALAEALVRRDLGSLPAPVLDDVPGLIHAKEPAEPSTDRQGLPVTGRKLAAAISEYKQSKATNYMWRFGECVVRVDAASSKLLLMTEPESASERAAFGTLGNALGTCLGEGRTIELGKADLRGTIAVNYYRLAIAGAGQDRQGTGR